MSAHHKWSSLRYLGLIFTLLTYGGLGFWFCKTSNWVGLFMLGYVAFVLAAFAIWRPRCRHCLTALLVAAIVLVSSERAQALLWQCFVGVVVVGVGVVLYVGLKEVCQNLPDLEEPPEPPQVPPAGTNSTALFISASPPVVRIGDEGVEKYSVSSAQFENRDPYGNPYTRYFRARVQSSTDLRTWSDEFSFQGWLSAQYVIMVYSDSNGAPVITNGCSFTGVATNEVALPFDTTSPVRFFRTANL